MKPVRWVAGGLVWLVAGVAASLGLLLSITIILLPLGIPLLMLSRRLFGLSARLVLPKAAVHPVQELKKRATDAPQRALGRGRDSVTKAARRRRRRPLRKRLKKRVRRMRKQLGIA